MTFLLALKWTTNNCGSSQQHASNAEGRHGFLLPFELQGTRDRGNDGDRAGAFYRW